ncbi:hypothetical protein DSL72_005921 [Monilinia vaccinii-corymbosi]|uniref:PHD-type domain-containing protein n=1 Tax=Monilinia vaccinii-corymbosi TaxID=61207 RepID=A0A8A3PGZ2_9HELO|nr:hypothetical protein DSL72_005921 [Monilinia vaccinii-corymbosi]
MISPILPLYIPSWVPGSRQEPSRQSVELASIDANGMSNAPNLRTRIKEDIENGVYDCPICHEPIGPDVGELWACNCCYQAYHPSCIHNWAQTSTNSSEYPPWQCPTCKKSHIGYPQAGCWCRRRDSIPSVVIAGSCGRSCSKENLCGTRVNCVTYTCPSICHPGPCIPKECTEQCGRERPQPPGSMAGDSRFNSPPPALTRGHPVISSNITNNAYRPSRRSIGSIYEGRANIRQQRRGRFALVNNNDNSEILMNDVFYHIPALFFINVLVLVWIQSRTRRYLLPLSYQQFTEGNFRETEQLLCLGAGAILFLFNTVSGASILVRLDLRLRMKLGLIPNRTGMTPDIPRKSIKIAISRALFFIYCIMLAYISILIPCMLCLGPGYFRRIQMEGTCDGFDTRIKLYNPDANYFGLQNKTTKQEKFVGPAYTQTPGRYDYPSPEDYESYKFGIDLFNITKINSANSSSSNRKSFGEYWRIMGIYGGKALHVDFDLLQHSWRISEGSIVVDGRNSSRYKHHGQFTNFSIPNFATAIRNLTQVRNGTWTRTDENNHHTLFPELKLHIPYWYLFDKHCAYQSYMRVFKEGVGEEGLSRKQIVQRREWEWKRWRKESRQEEVLRTASFGYGGNVGLEVCARRNEYTWERRGKIERQEGMGDDLLVPLGLMAVVRKSMREERGVLSHGCKWPGSTL